MMNLQTKTTSLAALVVGFVAGVSSHMPATSTPLFAQPLPRVFELRTYTVNDGRMPSLQAAFRDHWTKTLFAKHGMTGVIYLTPLDPALARTTLIYIVAHESRDAADKNWAAFGADPEVATVGAEENANGRAVAKVDSIFAAATDYSPIK